MAIENKVQEIQINDVVYEIQPRSIENRNTAESALLDKYDWVGTIEEYQTQQIAEQHPEWVCYITNDIKDGQGALDLADYVKKIDYNEDMTDVLHISENETITGTKTFVENDSQVAIVTKSKIVDNTQAPSIDSQRTNAIRNVDKNGVTLSTIYTVKKPDGSNGICLQAINGNDHYILGVDSNGNSIAPYPAASSSTSHINIATVGWVNDPTKSTNVVHRNSDEDISGRKTFTSGGHTLMIRRSATADWTDIKTEKADGTRTGGFRNILMGTDNETNMYVTSNDGSTILGAVSVSTDGTNSWAKAPASDVINSIITTTGILKSKNGYVKLGNGIIIQWGITPAITSNGQFVNLPTAFSSTNYSVVATMNYSGGSDRCSCHSFETTGFKMTVAAGGYQYNFIAIGY